MATLLANIKLKTGQSLPQGQAMPDSSTLPLGTCGFCERTLFESFRGAAGEGEESIWKSADRMATETAIDRPTGRFRCRHCGQVFTLDLGRPQRQGVGE